MQKSVFIEWIKYKLKNKSLYTFFLWRGKKKSQSDKEQLTDVHVGSWDMTLIHVTLKTETAVCQEMMPPS